jgi:hypothetical protein
MYFIFRSFNSSRIRIYKFKMNHLFNIGKNLIGKNLGGDGSNLGGFGGLSGGGGGGMLDGLANPMAMFKQFDRNGDGMITEEVS